MSSGAGTVGLAKAVENVRQKFRSDALASIAHCDLEIRIDSRQPNLNPALFGRELDRISKKIPDNLLQALGVPGYRPCLGIEHRLEPHAFGVSGWAHYLEGCFNYRYEFDRPYIQAQLSCDDSRDIQQIIDELSL